jgi:peptide/nickel transport system substrate-binding protein
MLTRSHIVRAAVLMIVIVATALNSACGAGGSSSQQTQNKQSVVVAFNQQVATLDPDQAVGMADLNAINLYGARLYEVDSQGVVRPTLVTGSTVSKDSLTWTFTLKKGLRFSDGSPLTAKDVAATFNRAIKDPANVQVALYAPMAKVQARGSSVVFRLKHPYPDIESVLAEEFAAVFPSAQVTKSSFFNHPVSAGPYRIVSWRGPNMTFEKNPYFEGSKPVVTKLRFVTVPDANTRLSQLKSGQIDFAADLPPSALNQLASSKTVSASVVKGYGWYSLDMSTRRGPLSDVRVRQAISLALDRERMVSLIWRGSNTPLSTFWPSTMSGYQTGDAKPQAAKAKELLGQSPYAKGATLTLDYSPEVLPFGDQMALLIQEDLAKIGITVKLQKTEFSSFNANLGSGDFQLALYGLYDFVNMPVGLLTYALDPNGGIAANFSGFSAPDANAVIQRMLETNADRQQSLAEVERVFAEHQPFATLATWAYVPGTRLPASTIRLDSSGLLRIGTAK